MTKNHSLKQVTSAAGTTTQHANATTTPEVRAFINESDLPTAVLARLLKISEATVRKWRKRESLDDASHVPKQLNTTLSEEQEYVVIELRTRLLLSLDELLGVVKQFINANVSRAGLQRCLKRHGVSRLADIADHIKHINDDEPATIKVVLEDRQAHQQLTSDLSPEAMRAVLNRINPSYNKSYDKGHDNGNVKGNSGKNRDATEVVQVKVTQLPNFTSTKSEESDNKVTDKTNHRLLIANDPTSGWVYVDVYDGNETEAANRYMSYVLTKAPFHIRRILAGNYNEFLSRFRLLNESPDEATTHFSVENTEANVSDSSTKIEHDNQHENDIIHHSENK